MYRDDEYFLNELRKNKVLYNIFICIGDYSSDYDEKLNFYQPKQVELKEIINIIKTNVLKKDNGIIQDYIDKLIEFGLIKYMTNDVNNKWEDNSDDKYDTLRLNNYKELGYPKEDSKIILTVDTILGCSGLDVYKHIMEQKQSEKDKEEFKEKMGSVINGITKPYDDKIHKMYNELQDKMNVTQKAVDDGIIKNIQVISVYAGIISLLFANVMGIKEYSTIGISGLLILNFCMVAAMFALILFTKLLIIGEKVDKKSIIICSIIILFIAIPAITIIIIKK